MRHHQDRTIFWRGRRAEIRIDGTLSNGLEICLRVRPPHDAIRTGNGPPVLFLPAALRSGELVASPLSALTPHARRVAVIIREAGRAASVEWHSQRDAAKRAVQNITGVRGVTNEITVKSRPKIADLRHRWLPLLIRDRPRDAGSRLCSLA